MVRFFMLWDNSPLTPLPPVDHAVSSLDGLSFALGPMSFHLCLETWTLICGRGAEDIWPQFPQQHPAPPQVIIQPRIDPHPQNQGVLYLIGSVFPCHGWLAFGEPLWLQLLPVSPPFSLLAHLTTWREEGHGAVRQESARLAPEGLGLPPLCVTAILCSLGQVFFLRWLWCPSCSMKRLHWLTS